MTRFNRLLGLALTLGVAIGASGVSLADESPAVTQVVTIDTKGKLDDLLAHAKDNEKIFERLGIVATRRYMRASFAGSNSGAIIVVIEYPNLASLAEAQEKLTNDAKWQKYIDKVTSLGMSIESNSLWVDITP